MGKKKAPFYRIVAIDSRKSRDGEYIECVGYYDPTKQPAKVEIKVEQAKNWLDKGAQPTETVKSLLKNAGVI
jgi:small subunit ribosomal protein S16